MAKIAIVCCAILLMIAGYFFMKMPSSLQDHGLLPQFELSDSISTRLMQRHHMPSSKYLLNVWGSWCVACKREHDFLLFLAQQGIPIVGVNLQDNEVSAKQWLDNMGNPYQINLSDPQGVFSKKLAIKGAPETYFIDTNGRIRYKFIGIVNADNWKKLSQVYDTMD